MVPRVSRKKGGAKERGLTMWRKRMTIKKRGKMNGRWTYIKIEEGQKWIRTKLKNN